MKRKKLMAAAVASALAAAQMVMPVAAASGSGSVDVDAPLTSLNEPADAIKIRFGHDNLIIESTAAIEAVSFYDMQGRMFQLPCMVNGTNAIVNMAAWNAPVIMACIRFADGTSHTVKLTR